MRYVEPRGRPRFAVTSVALEPEQVEALDRLGRGLNRSRSFLLRRAVRLLLATQAANEDGARLSR